VNKEFQQVAWDEVLQADCRELCRLAIREDLGSLGDVTTAASVPRATPGAAAVVSRQPGVVAGLPCAALAVELVDPRLRWLPRTEDGQPIVAGQEIARLEGPATGILAAERLLLNLLSRLSGVATLTRRYVDAIAGTTARIYDTRKTTPGWRRLEKYAGRCGGGWNHRLGLFAGVLIKDNHLAIGATREGAGSAQATPAEAVLRTRRYLAEHVPNGTEMIVEVEVDTLEQLDALLPAGPDIVLLDNMSPDQLRQAVARRNAVACAVELEASGGVNLQTVRRIAETGVERISVGALTHSAMGLDIGLDWA